MVDSPLETEIAFLGVDGGGTACRARLADGRGQVLGEGLAGAANTTIGLEAAFQAIIDAAHGALADAGWDPALMSTLHVGAGLAGLSLSRERRRVETAKHPFASLICESDAHVACLGAHGGRDGAILIAGTGSCGYLLTNGRGRSIGGWGPVISDQGSGARLGMAAVRAAVAAHDGIREASALSTEIMAELGGDPEAVYLWSEQALPRDWAALVPRIFAGAADDDPVAVEVVQASAAEIGETVEALMRLGAPAVALVGGLADAITPWLTPGCRGHLVPAAGDGTDGALLLARQHYLNRRCGGDE
jgi:glucosamine kinase